MKFKSFRLLQLQGILPLDPIYRILLLKVDVIDGFDAIASINLHSRSFSVLPD